MDSHQNAEQPEQQSEKSYVLAILLSYFFGSYGVDRFYLGYIPTGIIKLATFGGLGIWAIIDFIRITFGNLRDKQGRELQGFQEYQKTFKIVAIALLVLDVLVVIGMIIAVVILTNTAAKQNDRDTLRKHDLAVVKQELAVYHDAYSSFPSQTGFSDGTFQMKTILDIVDENEMNYSPTPSGCDGTVTLPCTSYSLSTSLEKGTSYTLSP